MPEEAQFPQERWMKPSLQDYCRELPLQIMERIVGIYQRYRWCPALEAVFVIALVRRMRLWPPGARFR